MPNKRMIAPLIAAAFAATHAGAHSYLSDASGMSEHRGETTLSEDSFPRHLTVFNPDGTSYSLVAQAYTIELEPALLVMSDESLPDQLTVFDPDGSVTSYRFTPVEIGFMPMPTAGSAFAAGEMALYDASAPMIVVEIAEPIVVGMADDESIGQLVWFDSDGAPWPDSRQLARFDAAEATTG